MTTGHTAPSGALEVYLEVGRKRVFAGALAWPGWLRGGPSAEAALAALAAYAPRYARVAREAGLVVPPIAPADLHVVDRVAGVPGYTDFGVPAAILARDRAALNAEEAARQLALLGAAWLSFDRVAAAAPAELRKGPRGGGRDRNPIIEHVLNAEAAYARKLGLRHPAPARTDSAAIAAQRGAISGALRAALADGTPSGDAHGGWPARYALRRLAWHLLDHAWEMEDRGRPDGAPVTA